MYKNIHSINKFQNILGCFAVTLFLIAWVQGIGFSEDFNDNGLQGWEHSENAFVAEGVLHIEPGGFAYYPGLWEAQEFHLDLTREGAGDLVVGFARSDETGFNIRLGMDFIGLYRMQGQEAIEIAFVPLDYPPPGNWFRLTVNYTGTHVDILLFDEPMLMVDVNEPVLPGGLELRTAGEVVGMFDNINLVPLSVEKQTGEDEKAAEGTEPGEPPQEATGVGEQTTQPVAGSSQPAYVSTQWVYTGGPSGGLGYDIRMRPDDPDRMFVTDALTGVFRSTDGGQTWSQSNSGITTRLGRSGDAIPIFSLTIDPNHPDTVWAGTQYSSGIFKSMDGGVTWTGMNTGSNGIQEAFISVRGLSIQPGNSAVVYFAGEVSSWDWNGEALSGKGLDMTKGVIYKSTDGGLNWTRVWYGDNLARYVLIHPENPDVLFASTGIFDREAANSDPTTDDPGGVGILRSYDGGQTWQELNENNGLDAESLYFGSLFMDPHHPDILFAAAGNDPYNRPGGVYRTTDGGDSWTKVLDLLHASAVEVCEGNSNVVYAGSINGFQRSDDGGDTWIKLADTRWGPPAVVAGFPIDLQCDPRNSDRIFVNNYGGGNFLSEDGGETWVNSSQGYTGALMREVEVAQNNSGLVYAAARSGVFSSWDGGQTWNGLSSGVARDLEAYYIAVDPFNALHLYLGLEDTSHVPKESKDGGQTWSDVFVEFLVENNAPVNTLTNVYFNPGVKDAVFFAPGDPRCAYQPGTCDSSKGTGLYLSRDGGVSWSQTSLNSGTIIQMAFSRDGSVVYAGDLSGFLHRSTDDGQTWQTLPTNALPAETISPEGIQTAVIVGLLVDPADTDLLYVGADPGGFFISNDGGQTWQASNRGMPPEIHIADMVMDPANSQVLYLGTNDSGVYLSQDGGMNWQAFNQGLSMREIQSLTISNDGSVVYAATWGAGVFRLGVPSASGQSPALQPQESGEIQSSAEPGAGQPPGDAPIGEADQAGTQAEKDNRLPISLILGVVGGLLLLGAIVGFVLGKRKNQA